VDPYTFIFFGNVGSGKGTQVKLLQEYLAKKDGKEQVYVYPGAEYRRLVKSGNYTGKLVEKTIVHGHLQPDFLTTSIVADILISNLTPEKYLFFDGYPRTVAQSESLEEMMDFYARKTGRVKIIYLGLSREEALKRNLKRGRHDDTEAGLAKRFDEYEKNVVPSMNYFKGKEGYEIYSINGEQSVEDVHKDIIAALNLWKKKQL
jgi:adenylate kinase